MLSIQSRREKREAVIRAGLLERLRESVQSLLHGPGGQGIPRLSAGCSKGPILGHTDNTNALCCVLEAVFIHGLKDSLGERLSSMFLGDLDRMPVPNFWLVVMVISHRDLIEQVSSLSYIMSDVGKGRAWMRLALNQGQLISYLSVLASEIQTLKDYYRSNAFLRDVECCDIMLRILQPLVGITFNLSTNAAVLNTWTQTPLIYSGIWIPAKYEHTYGPVISATDVASTFTDETAENQGMAIPQTPLSDQMFDLIIGCTPETNFINDNIGNEENNATLDSKTAEIVIKSKKVHSKRKNEIFLESNTNETDNSSKDVNLKLSEDNKIIKCSAQTSQNDQDDNGKSESYRRVSSTTTTSERESIMNRSISIASDTGHNEYRSLFSDWETTEAGEQLPSFLTTNISNPFCHINEISIFKNPKEVLDEQEESDFEILPSKLLSEEEIAELLPLMTTIIHEEGLDFQNYHCNDPQCSLPIGMIYGKPRLCKFDGRYYCGECHVGDTSIIPSRVIHNWDFTLYPVCLSNKKWLDNLAMQPLINIRLVNPKLYEHVDDLAEMQNLRIQLHFVQAYLFTCRSDTGQELRKLVWPREYLYEHVHLYSVFDLEKLYQGKLIPVIRQAVTMGRSHILNCSICSPRGFICEVCKDSRIIYPFQLGDTFTCGVCCGVFHNTCVKKEANCPRCKRISKRRIESSQEVM